MNVTTGRGERQEEEESSPHPGQAGRPGGAPRGAEAGSTQSCQGLAWPEPQFPTLQMRTEGHLGQQVRVKTRGGV